MLPRGKKMPKLKTGDVIYDYVRLGEREVGK